jgi:ribosomal protein L11 methyltransferase
MRQSTWFKVECTLRNPQSDIDEVLWEWVSDYECLGIEASLDNTRITLFFPTEAHAQTVASQLNEWLRSVGCSDAVSFVVEQVQKANWNEEWKKHFRPTPVGESFVILPPWENADSFKSVGRVPIVIEPGMAFGTGTHATTQLCLRLLESLECQNRSVLDVGTGSGILAIAASLRGAAWCLGIDIDPDIIENAAKNIELNSIPTSKVSIVVGQLDTLTRDPRFDIILCNMLHHEAEPILDNMINLITENGYFCLSGYLQTEAPRVEADVLSKGLIILQRDSIDEWAALLARRG